MTLSVSQIQRLLPRQQGNDYIGFPMDLQLLTCEDFPEAAAAAPHAASITVLYKMDLVAKRFRAIKH
jgi:hypothetical protein